MNKEQIKLAMIMTNSTVKMVSTVDCTEQLLTVFLLSTLFRVCKHGTAFSTVKKLVRTYLLVNNYHFYLSYANLIALFGVGFPRQYNLP